MLVQIVLAAEFGVEKGAGQLRAQLLPSVVRRAPVEGERPIQPPFVPGPVAQFVKGRPVVGRGAGKAHARRQDDAVLARLVVGANAPVLDRGATTRQQRLQAGLRVPRRLRQGLARAVGLLQRWQALDLRGVKHGGAPQQGHGPDRFIPLPHQRSQVVPILRPDLQQLVKTNRRSPFPLAHLPAACFGLPVATPARIAEQHGQWQ